MPFTYNYLHINTIRSDTNTDRNTGIKPPACVSIEETKKEKCAGVGLLRCGQRKDVENLGNRVQKTLDSSYDPEMPIVILSTFSRRFDSCDNLNLMVE